MRTSSVLEACHFAVVNEKGIVVEGISETWEDADRVIRSHAEKIKADVDLSAGRTPRLAIYNAELYQDLRGVRGLRYADRYQELVKGKDGDVVWDFQHGGDDGSHGSVRRKELKPLV